MIKAEKIAIHVRFRGGQTTSLSVERPKPIALVRKTLPEVIQQLDQLLDTCSDREAAVLEAARFNPCSIIKTGGNMKGPPSNWAILAAVE